MSQSYRKLYCSLTVAGEAKGSKSDKQRSNRTIRRSNKIRTASITSGEDDAVVFKTKKNVNRNAFRGEGCKTAVNPDRPENFHIKRLPGGRKTTRTRMVK